MNAGVVDQDSGVIAAAADGARISAALMAVQPSLAFGDWRGSGDLARLFPELDALFGVPQSADEPAEVDVGEHQLRVIDQAARRGASLAVRWAALLHKLGKAGSPKEFLPGHLGHEKRGEPLLNAVCDRYALDAETRDLALLVLRECDKVHRAVDMRAAAIVGLLERIDALRRPQRFEHLLTVCVCDYAAYPGRDARNYTKAERLRRAAQACTEADARCAAGGEASSMEQRARAVAEALQSEIWGLG